MLYDRSDRSTGTAFVTYISPDDARQAVREFDGANAYGQPIRVSRQPAGPSTNGRPARNPFDHVEKPSRSLFDRIESSTDEIGSSRAGRNGRGGRRSVSPAKDGVDRYVPSHRRESSRSPIRRRGTPRETGHRPGARREHSGRPGPRGGGAGGGAVRRTDSERRQQGTGARPRKTVDELDAEMNDYWGDGGAGQGQGQTAGQGDAAMIANASHEARGPQVATVQNGANPGQSAPAPLNEAEDIDLMVE